jgi:hypothetical protein
VLARLEQIGRDELRELIIDAWLARAPKRAATSYLIANPPAPQRGGAAIP